MAWSFRTASRLTASSAKFLAVILSFLLLFFTAPAIAETQSAGPGGIGGTGHGDDTGEGNGIGGTGGPHKPAGNGGTGIVGTITGFGSIFVNRLEVDYSAETPTKSDIDDRLDAKTLRVGQVVEIEAEGEGNRLQARRISARYEVVGPIQSIDRQANTVVVLGQTVSVAKSAIETAQGQTRPLSELAVGETVQVSGLRRPNGVIVASRIDGAASGRPAWLRGKIEAVDEKGYTINGVRVETAGSRNNKLTIGDEAGVRGVFSDGRIKTTKFINLPREPFAGRIGRLSIEGYVGGGTASGRSVGGLNLRSSGSAEQARVGDRIIANGKIGNKGEFIAENIQRPQFGNFARRPGDLGRTMRSGRPDFHAQHPRQNHWRNGGGPRNRGPWRRGRNRWW